MRAFALVLLLTACSAPVQHQDVGSPRKPAAWYAPRVARPGLPNLHRVSSRLYRSAQPSTEGMRELPALGVTTVGAALVAPGVVQAGGTGVTSLGPHGRANSLREMLRQADFSVDVVTNLDSLLWGKLAINAGINPLTALLRIPNGQLLHRPTATALMHAAALETATVAAALGISLPFPDPADAVTAVATRTAGNISSMLQDIQRGAPTEIEAICGEIIRAGESVGIPTPINRTLYQLVAALAAPPDEPLPQNP